MQIRSPTSAETVTNMRLHLLLSTALVLVAHGRPLDDAAVAEDKRQLPCNYDYCTNYCKNYVCVGWPDTDYW